VKLTSANFWLVGASQEKSLPVLENLRWRAVDGHLELTATDLDNSLYMSVPFAAPAIHVSADVLVPAKELHQAVKTESAPNLEIRIREGKFEVIANNRSLALPCSAPKAFPEIPDAAALTALAPQVQVPSNGNGYGFRGLASIRPE